MHAPATQVTLLERLRDRHDEASWRRFEGLYREVVVRAALRSGLQATDAEDVAQAVFASLWRSMPSFTLDRTRGRFRDYLFRAVQYEIIRQKKRLARPIGGQGALSIDGSPSLRDPHLPDETLRILEHEWIDHHIRLALEEIRQTHLARSVEIFECLLAGTSIEATAARFEASTDSVRKIRQRIRDALQEVVRRNLSSERHTERPG